MISKDTIHWAIQPKNVWPYFQENKHRLTDTMDTICKSDSDDEGTAWWLFVTCDFSDENTLLLSLETSDTIVDSASCSGPENIEAEIDRLLASL